MYFSRMKRARTTLLAASSRSVNGTWRQGHAITPLSLPQAGLLGTSSLRPRPQKHSHVSVPNTPARSHRPSVPPALERETPSLVPPPLPVLGAPAGAHGPAHTHPTLFLPRDGDALEFPLQHHVTLPQASVTLPLTLLLVEPVERRVRGRGLGPAAGQAPAPPPPRPRTPLPRSLEVRVTVRLQEILLGPKQDVRLQPRGEGTSGQADDEGQPLLGSLAHARCCACGVTRGPHGAVEPCTAPAALAPRRRGASTPRSYAARSGPRWRAGDGTEAQQPAPRPALPTPAPCCLPGGPQRRDGTGKGQRRGSKCPMETEGRRAGCPMPLPHHNPPVCVPPHSCLAVPPMPHTAAWLYPPPHPVAARCAFPPQAIWL